MVIRLNTLVVAAVAILATAASCSKGDFAEMPDGIAYVSTSGTVYNIENTQPIEGIRVIINSREDASIVGRDTVFTNAEGQFKANLSKYRNMSCEICAEDIDGEEKGGEFESGLILIKEVGTNTHSIDNQQFYLSKKKK